MSAYHEQTTEYRDRDLLVAALADCGYKDCVSIFETAQTLIDYHGQKRPESAEIIIRRKHINWAANDIGFKLNPQTGCYGAIISEYDSYKHNAEWLNHLKVAYAEKGLIKKAQSQGYRLANRKLNTTTNKVDFDFVKIGR